MQLMSPRDLRKQKWPRAQTTIRITSMSRLHPTPQSCHIEFSSSSGDAQRCIIIKIHRALVSDKTHVLSDWIDTARLTSLFMYMYYYWHCVLVSLLVPSLVPRETMGLSEWEIDRQWVFLSASLRLLVPNLLTIHTIQMQMHIKKLKSTQSTV